MSLSCYLTWRASVHIIYSVRKTIRFIWSLADVLFTGVWVRWRCDPLSQRRSNTTEQVHSLLRLLLFLAYPTEFRWRDLGGLLVVHHHLPQLELPASPLPTHPSLYKLSGLSGAAERIPPADCSGKPSNEMISGLEGYTLLRTVLS
jgi:hypothetical protein